MSKITIPISEVQIGGSLFNFYYNNCILRSDVAKETNSINATAIADFNLSIGEVGSILNNGGEVEEYLMSVKGPIALLDQDVPEGLPNRLTLDGTAQEIPKQFKNWLVPGAEIWIKDDQTEIIFYTNPFAGNQEKYLKGSEISIINQISAQVNILTIEDSENETSTGWTKL